MKKILLIAAAVLFGASAFAQTVTSANIVGYSKTNLDTNQLKIVGLQFSGDGSDSGVVLSNAYTGLAGFESVLYRYNGAGYDVFSYYGPVNGWYQGANPANGAIITNGLGLWLKGNSGDETVAIQSGDVPSFDAYTNSAVRSGIDLVSNPYPVATVMSNLTGTAVNSGTTIAYVLKETEPGYYVITYYGPVNGWYEGANPANAFEIGIGKGFWLKSAAGGSLIFNKNY